MLMGLRTKKSAGIRVTPAVHGLIREGNRRRDAGAWHEAAGAYRAALAADPSLYHIWIQLGHALKEDGRIEAAQDAYEAAGALRPGDGETRLLMAHLAKRAGQPRLAGRRFAALLADGIAAEESEFELAKIVKPVATFGSAELHAILRDDDGMPAADLEQVATTLDAVLGGLADDPRTDAIAAARALLARIAGTPADAAPRQAMPGDRPLVFDISDLVAHFRYHRLPTGIQRVQIEVLVATLRTYGHERVGICCFIDGRDHWIELPVAHFLKLAYLASAGGEGTEAAWQVARGQLFFNLALDDPYDLPDRAILINLGTSWWIYDYFRLIREAKATKGIAYIAMVFDLIPILAPQYCVAGVTGDYISWAVGVFQHADAYFAISESTKRDLLRVAARLGHTLAPERVEVTALDADFRRTAAAPLPAALLRGWQLDERPFALFVSTIEARKNHNLAFDAWAELIRRHGRDALPRLVCVGRNGWLNDQAFARLDADAELRAHVTIIHQASDEELALLYRSCRFTVYPSHYEGWGLPVTESLCYGRVPIVADNSSLPEAGGDLALMVESDSIAALVEAVEKVAFDDAWRAAREARIAAEFRPRTWGAIAQQISDAVIRFAADRPAGDAVRRDITPGIYYPTRLYRGLQIWPSLASGEIFRAGEGWLWPEPDGCRTKRGGSELRMTIAGPAVPLRLYLLLRGLAAEDCPFSLAVAGERLCRGRLRAGERRWVMVDLPPAAGPELSLIITGEAEERIEMPTGGTVKHLLASLTVLGFALCPRDDAAARTRFIEAAALGDVEDIGAYREPVAAGAW